MKYVALLRGIGPGNPNMQNAKLRGILEDLGLSKVKSVISSGNLIFESPLTDTGALEKQIEQAWPQQLGFMSTTIVRSQKQLEKLARLDPFKDLHHGPGSYLLTTFLKQPAKSPFKLPYQPPGKTYTVLAATLQEVFTTTDNTVVKTTDLMTWLEKQYGKDITSRTWLTVNRILKKMSEV